MKTRGEEAGAGEAETGVMLPQATEHLGHQEPGEAREDPPLEPLRGVALPAPDFRLLAPRTVREQVFTVLSHLVCGTLVFCFLIEGLGLNPGPHALHSCPLRHSVTAALAK